MKTIFVKLSFIFLFIFFCFIGYTNLLAQEVAVYNDKETAWIDPNQMVASLGKMLPKNNISYKVVKAFELEDYMNANPKGIVIMTTGIAPGDIFKNQGDKDLVHQWLFGGGIMFWSGDWPFYYWDAPANCPGAAGERSVFGVTFTTSSGPPGQNMEPTDLGKELIPSIMEHQSSRPVMIATLESNKFEFESYADNGANADPIALRSPKMDGWFVNMHTWIEGVSYDQVALEISELIKNRFLVMKAVNRLGKSSITWGNIKGD